MIFPEAMPEEVGVSSLAIHRTLDYLEQRKVALHSLLILRHDALICEAYARPFTKNTLHRMYSETKSYVSLAIGCMFAKGYLEPNDHIVDYFPEKLPHGGPKSELAQLTIRDMLRMTTPYSMTTYKHRPTKDWVGSFFTARADHAPGSYFCYDTSSSHTLCALVEKCMGMPLLGMLRSEALTAIGFSKESYCIKDPMGVSQGGSGLMATSRDMLSVLDLIAKGGIWQGHQLLPREYLAEATSFQIDTLENGGANGWDFAQGYGYQFWRLTHNAWCMFGMGGQLAICLPEQDMLIVTTADTQPLAGGVQTILDAFWNCLLPGVMDTSLSSDTVAYTELLHRVSDMELPRVENLARPVVNNCVKVNLGPNAPGMTALQLDEECLTLYYGERVCLLPYQAGNLVQSCLWNDSAIPCVIAAGWRTPDTILFRIHLLGERLGSLSLQLRLGTNHVTLNMCSHEEHPDRYFMGTASGKQER